MLLPDHPTLLASAYVFADRFIVPQLKRDAIDKLHRHYHTKKKAPSLTVLQVAFENLPESSPLLNLLVDLEVRYSCVGTDKAQRRTKDLPPLFLVRVLAKFNQLRQHIPHQHLAKVVGDPSTYHDQVINDSDATLQASGP